MILVILFTSIGIANTVVGKNNNIGSFGKLREPSNRVKVQPPSRSKPPPQKRKPITQSRRSRAMTPTGWEFGGNIGTSHSLTEIGGSKNDSRGFIMDTQFEATSINIGAFGRYRFDYWLAAEVNFNYASISGADSLSPIGSSRYNRGFYFNNNIYELAAKAIGYAPRINHKIPLDIYAYLGVAGFYHNPSLSVPDPSNYDFEEFSNYQIALPMGLGAYYIFEQQYKLGLEIGWRKTFTDYLNGFTRPASKGYDSYYFTAIRFSYFINKQKRNRYF